MFCPKCGTRSAAQSERCAACGYDFGLIPEEMRGRETGFEAFENEHSAAEAPVYETELTGSRDEFSTQNTEDEAFRTQSAEDSVFAEQGADKGLTGGEKKKKECGVGVYMIPAILLTVFGSMAFGIVSIIFSGMTQTELAAGNKEKAAEYSEKTRMFCLISLLVGIAKYLIIGVLFAVLALNAR